MPTQDDCKECDIPSSGMILDEGNNLFALVRCFIKDEAQDKKPQIGYQGGCLVRPKLPGNYPRNRFLSLETYVEGAQKKEVIFVLISPDLNNKIITRLLTLLKQYRVTCGFSVEKVHLYDRVILVDPNHDYPDNLKLLKEAGIRVDELSSEGDLKENLKKLLSE